MARHNQLGKEGEIWARQFLEDKGYRIVEMNWRYRQAEIDIIAQWEQWLIFIEVKTRTTAAFGQPEEFVTPAKERRMAQAAFAYLEKYNHSGEVRFDVISILAPAKGARKITHFEDAFFPGL